MTAIDKRAVPAARTGAAARIGDADRGAEGGKDAAARDVDAQAVLAIAILLNPATGLGEYDRAIRAAVRREGGGDLVGYDRRGLHRHRVGELAHRLS